MMSIEHVLAVVPVSDIERAEAWYEALFGRPRRQPADAELGGVAGDRRRVSAGHRRRRPSGSGLLNFAVDELAATRDELGTRGVETTEIQPVNKGVELSATTDPDGNAITLIGNFRVKY